MIEQIDIPDSFPSPGAVSGKREYVTAAIERLLQAIEHSGASLADRQAATALLRAFQQHPLLHSLLQAEAAGLNQPHTGGSH